MKLFPIELRPGVPVYEQVLYGARKAIISGDLAPGDLFPRSAPRARNTLENGLFQGVFSALNT